MADLSDRPGPARILVVDDDPLVRAGLRLMLGGADDLDVVGEAADGWEAERQVAALRPDLVLMDIRMPRRDGLAATESIRSVAGGPLVVVLTTFQADESVLSALRAGASGFLLKDTPPDRIVAALRRVLAGEQMLSPSALAEVIKVATQPRSDRTAQAERLLAGLTEREREVALAIAHGKSNAEIAEDLFVSVATVKAYAGRLFDKLEVDNRIQVALRVHDAGWV